MAVRRRPVSNLLGLAVLGLLLEQPMHPYEMAATLRERNKDTSFKVKNGSLYDVVESLVRAGWIAEHSVERAGAGEAFELPPVEHARIDPGGEILEAGEGSSPLPLFDQ